MRYTPTMHGIYLSWVSSELLPVMLKASFFNCKGDTLKLYYSTTSELLSSTLRKSKDVHTNHWEGEMDGHSQFKKKGSDQHKKWYRAPKIEIEMQILLGIVK